MNVIFNSVLDELNSFLTKVEKQENNNDIDLVTVYKFLCLYSLIRSNHVRDRNLGSVPETRS